MKELAKLEELRQEMEKGLDGLDHFVETWEDYFARTEGGRTRIVSPIEEIATKQELESMERITTEGRAFVAGMKLVIDELVESLKIAGHETAAAEERSRA